MSETNSVLELQQWAESLRSQVSRLSGRTKNGVPGFNAELKGDLLDAIDLLLEREIQEEDTADPVAESLAEVQDQFAAFAETITAIRESTDDSLKQSDLNEIADSTSSTLMAAIESDLLSAVKNADATEVVNQVRDQVEQVGEQTQAIHDLCQGIEERLEQESERSQEDETSKAVEEILASQEEFRGSSEQILEELSRLRRDVESLSDKEGVEHSDATDEALREKEEALLEVQCQLEENEAKREQAELARRDSDDKLSRIQEELDEARLQASGLEEEVDRLRTRQAGEDQEQNAALTERIRVLESSLEEAQLELEDATSRESMSTEAEELQSKLQAAFERIESLESENTELSQQLEQGDAVEDRDGLSWEQQKAMIMKQYQAEDGDTPDDVESLVEKTDAIVAEKDREIEQLREQLDAAVEDQDGEQDAQIEAVLDADEIVQEERRKLEEIQAEWQEKLRVAEVDLSKERARIARERRELESELEAIRRKSETEQGGRTRKWLDHLGLRDEVTEDDAE
ncbi:MAG: hypothetical protein AAGG44_09670 [Planctomycetota bacterium]